MYLLLGELFPFLGCINPCKGCLITSEACLLGHLNFIYELPMKNKLTRIFFLFCFVLFLVLRMCYFAPFLKLKYNFVYKISQKVYQLGLIFGILFRA